MLSLDQRQFLYLFVLDGEYDLVKTAASMGLRPTEARGWFKDQVFQAELRRAQHAKMLSMGYGSSLVMEDTLAIAHSDISAVQAIEGDLSTLPRHVRVAIKKVKFKVATDIGSGKAVVYPAEVEMHEKSWALRQAAEWFAVKESPEAKNAQATQDDSGPKRITGLVVRPPLTYEDKEIEDLLR
jgi:hypothetical protein